MLNIVYQKLSKISTPKIMGERREKRKKNNKSYQEFQTSQPPKIVGGCNCDTYVATSESILQPPVATPGCGFSQPKKNQVATKFLQPPSPGFGQFLK
jgi:hypothetical protein